MAEVKRAKGFLGLTFSRTTWLIICAWVVALLIFLLILVA
jgi:hypothetical protein